MITFKRSKLFKEMINSWLFTKLYLFQKLLSDDCNRFK